MALTDKSLFLYNFQVTPNNCYIPFLNVNAGTEIDAIVPSGYYTLGSLATAIAAAMNVADPAKVYTCTVARNFSGNLQNRITIATSGSFLSLLWSSSPLAASSITSLINFGSSNNTGALTYTNSTTSGTALQTSWYGFNYQPPSLNLRTIGSVNIASDGTKEVVWWSVQQFINVEFKYETQAFVLANWQPMMAWMAQGRPFEFTPVYSTPGTVYSCTLEKSPGGSNGLGFLMREMVPEFPLLYTTGALEFRLLAGTY